MSERRNYIQKKIKDYIGYEPESGKLFAIKSRSGIKIGQELGYIKKEYLMIKFNGVEYACHRVAFFLHYGYSPKIIDHKNRIKTDNRIINLLDSNKSKNRLNSKISSSNTSGVNGLHFNKERKKWLYRKTISGKQLVCGVYESKEDAIKCLNDTESIKMLP